MSYTMSVVDETDIQTWADIGVIFTLFSLGLDFSLYRHYGGSPQSAVYWQAEGQSDNEGAYP